jgi:dipeptidyl aminopeptidase/acylaminoacyl peptidase
MKRLLVLTLTLPLVLSTVLTAQQPRRVKIMAKSAPTHESLWLMKRVGAPALSPDGKWVVVSVSQPAYDEKDATSDLWLAPADGSAEPRRITFNKPAESDATWSPDSRRVAFSAKREGDDVNQIYVIDVASGGEAQRVTSSATGARTPRFSPDGNTILFSTTAYPDTADDEDNRKAAKERKDAKSKVHVFDSYPIRMWDRWIDETHTHIAVQPLGPAERPRDLLAKTNLIKEAGFAGRGAEGSREEIEAAWSPDGNSVVFTATTTRNTAAYAEHGYDLYRVALDASEPVRIAHAEGSYGRPQFSPDGKTLYATFEENNTKVYNLTRLVAFDWPSMEHRRVVTPAPFDRSVGGFAITPDSRTIYFTAEEFGLEKIFSVPANGGSPALAVDPESGVYTDLSIARNAPSLVMVGRWGSSINPAEVVRIDPAAQTKTNLTSFDVDAAARMDWLPPQHFWFTSSRGKKIHNMLVVPAGFDPNGPTKYPLLVLMHGGPASQWRDDISYRWNYHLLARPGYVVLLTNYTGSTGFGEKFAQDIQGDPLKGPGMEVNEAADAAVKKFPFIDGTRMAAAGASYGGHLANWLEATTTRYKCLISHAGLVSLEQQWGTSDVLYGREQMNLGPWWEKPAIWREQSPSTYAKDFKTPMLLSVGEHDYRVPMNNTLEMFAILQRQRVPSRLLVWPEANHWITNGEDSKVFYTEVANWLKKFI